LAEPKPLRRVTFKVMHPIQKKRINAIFLRYAFLAIGIAILQCVTYFIFLIVGVLGYFTCYAGKLFVEVILIILQMPLLFLMYEPSVSRFLDRAQSQFGDNNVLNIIAACNALIWGMAIVFLRHKRKRYSSAGAL
jgi:hypothetical protein